MLFSKQSIMYKSITHKIGRKEIYEIPGYILGLIGIYLLAQLCACKKNNNQVNIAPKDSTYFNPPNYKLKSYAIANIGNSHYSFTYDAMGRLATINHSGLDRYKCFYQGKALYNMINENPFTSADTINYYYNAGLLNRIDIIPENDVVSEKLDLAYDHLKRVTQINWQIRTNDSWNTNRKLVFTYYPDNNISTYKNYYYNGTVLSLFDSTSYVGYDNKINPKVNFFIFGLLNDHFVYLPYVKLQMNNPINETLIRGTNTFKTEHHYTYLDSLVTNDNKTINVIPNNGVPYNFTGAEFYEYY